MARWVPRLLVALIAAGLFAGWLVDSPLWPKSEAQRFIDRIPDPHRTVTLADYQALRDGMSYQEIRDELGPGRELTRSMIGRDETIAFEWANADGGRLSVIVQNDKLLSKSAHDLR